MTGSEILEIAKESQGQIVMIYTEEENIIGNFDFSEEKLEKSSIPNTWQVTRNGSTSYFLGTRFLKIVSDKPE